MASVRGFITGAVIPLIGSAVLMYAFVKSLAASAAGVILPTVAVLALALALGFVLQHRRRAPFFQREAAEKSALPGLALGVPDPVRGLGQTEATDQPKLGEHS